MSQDVDNVERIARDWKSRDFSCGLWVDPPGQIWEDFTHGVDEIMLVIYGKIRLEVKGKSLILTSGEEALIPAKTCHTVENIGGTTARWLYEYKQKARSKK